EAARESEQLRAAVLDSLAHAFKTPLTAIGAASSGLLELGRLDPESAELAHLIDEETARLSQLTTDLLRMARIDAAEVRLRCETVVLPELIREILAENRTQLGAHRFQVIVPGDSPVVWADRSLLATALLQLIDNAAKYSTPESIVVIRASEADGEALVAVHNDGAPIRAGDRERIFERFYRAADSKHRAAGAGLGLSIVKKAAEAHRGRV